MDSFLNKKVAARARRSLTIGVVSLFVASAALGATQKTAPVKPVALSVPATFVRQLTPPGSNNQLVRPEYLFIDNKFNEIFVCDPGNNRIVVFDTSGLYKFEFSGKEKFSDPYDVVVDGEGYIYVVGNSKSGKAVHVFDYDGLYLRQLEFKGLPGGHKVEIGKFTIDEANNLYVIDESAFLLTVFDREGNFLHEFPLLSDLTEAQRRETILGNPLVHGENLYLPVSTFGSVYVYDLAGNLIQSIGQKGNETGNLNFPISVAVSNQIIIVLDKHRFSVICFSSTGEFLGEFGGMGTSLGWFYHPSFLAVDNLNRVYIAQIFMNRIQVCEFPEFIIERAASLKSSGSQSGEVPKLIETIGEEVDETQTDFNQRFSTFNF